MRKWELTSKDIVITGNAPYDIGLRLEIGDLNKPSLMIYNSKMRYVSVRVRQLPGYMTTIPTDNFSNYMAIDYNAFGQAPPGLLFRKTNLLSGKDKVTATLIGSGVDSNEELPLTMSAAQAGGIPGYQNWGRFLITCQAPSLNDSSTPTQGESRALAWVLTIFDYYLLPILNSVIFALVNTGDKDKKSASRLKTEFYLEIITEIWDIVYNVPNIPLTSTNAFVQMTDLIVGKIIALMSTQKVIDWFIGKLGNTGAGLLFSLIPLTKHWKSIIEFCNFVQQVADIFSPGLCQYMVEITPRLKPTFRFPSKDTVISLPLGNRAQCPVEVTLPNGNVMAFSTLSALCVQYPAHPSQGMFQESYTADVEAVLPDERGYTLSSILDVTAGNPSLFPGKLTISSSQSVSYPIVTTRPLGVSPQAVQQGSGPVRCSFPKGLGAFIKSVSEGSEEVTLRFEMDESVWPMAISRTAEAKVRVNAVTGTVNLDWYGIGEVCSGQSFNLPLTLRTKAGDLYFMDGFSASADFSPDLQKLTLTRIVIPGTEGLSDGPHTYPFRLELSMDGKGTDGKPIAELNPSRKLRAESAVRPVTFEKGFLKMGYALQPGKLKITAVLLPEDPTEENNHLQWVEEVTVNIAEGKPVIKAAQSIVEFEDSDTADVDVRVELPDKDIFGTGDVLQAMTQISLKEFKLSSIIYRPDEDEPPKSPVDLAFTIDGPCGAVFTADTTTHAMNSTKPYVGSVKDFIRAANQGDGNLVIRGVVLNNSRAKLKDPLPLTVPIKIAPPAKAALEGFVPGNQPDEDIQVLNNGGSFKIWKYNSILLKFRVENHSDKTSVKVLVNGSAYPGAVLKAKNGKTASFEVLIQNMNKGVNTIAVEAEKATNFGKPLGESFFLEGLRPKADMKEVPPRHTGKKKQNLSVDLEYTCEYKLVVKNNSRTILEVTENCVNPNYSSGINGFFAVYHGFNIDEGDNTILLIVSNAFETYNVVDNMITGHKPEFADLKANGNAFNASGKVDVDLENVAITGRVAYSTQLTADNNALVVRGDGGFSYSKSISGDGVHNIVLKSVNDFGNTQMTLFVNLLPIDWVYNFIIGFARTDTDQLIQVQVRNPHNSSSITWDTGKCTDYNTPHIVRFLEKNIASAGNLFPSFTIKCYQWSEQKWDYVPGGGSFYNSIQGQACRFRGTRELEAYQMACIVHPTRADVITYAIEPNPGSGMVAYISANIESLSNEWVTIVYGKGARIR